MPALLLAQQGPGWHYNDSESNALVTIPVDAGLPPLPVATLLSTEGGAGASQQITPITNVGNEADEITPEITELARGLQYDPLLIFEYCRNHISYEHYFGSKKGATLTLLEGSGNSFDTAALMVALLRASGVTANYVYGPRYYTAEQMADQLGLWHYGDSGMPYPHLTDAEFRAEFGLQGDSRPIETLRFLYMCFNYSSNRGFPDVITDSLGQHWYLPQVWIKITYQNAIRQIDPSFKTMLPATVPVDLQAATGFDRSTIISQVSQGATVNNNYVQNLDEGNLDTYLTARTSAFLQWLKANRPNEPVSTLIGIRSYDQQTYADLNALPSVLQNSGFSWLPVVDWNVIPTQWMSKLTIKAGEFNYTTDQYTNTRFSKTINMPSLKGEKLSLAFSGNNGTLYLEESALDTGATFSVPNADTDVQTLIDHPHGNYNRSSGVWTDDASHDQVLTKAYRKGNSFAFAFAYGFDPSGRLLRKRQEILDGYLRDPAIADDSRQVVTELLNLMGLNFFLQTRLSERVVGGLYETTTFNHHLLGRVSQEEGYYIDVGMIIAGDRSTNANYEDAGLVFRLGTQLASALEHSVIEQMQGQGVAATSSIKVLQLANEQGFRVYRGDSSNWSSIVRPHLVNNGYGSQLLSEIDTVIGQSDGEVLIPGNPQISLNQWEGAGAAALSEVTALMPISGNLLGGFASVPDDVDTEPVQEFNYFESSYQDTGSSGLIFTSDPLTTLEFFGADPVDMLSGAFVFDKTDLELGQAIPRGLSFSRSYNSNRRYDKSNGLGYGWTHSLDIRVTERSNVKAAMGETTQYQMAPYLAALTAVKDLYENSQGKPVRWLTACLAIKWATDQLTYKSAAVTMGSRTIEFIEMPDGSYVPPAGITLSLEKNGQGRYVLQERHGNTFNFDADNRVSTISDQYNKTQTFTYTNDKLTQVQDAYGRTLILTWTGDKITQVADSTGRSVIYTYSSDDLISIADPDNHSWSFVYDTEHRITELRDPKNQVIVQNTYDSQSRVDTQQSEGNVNKTTNFYFTGYRNIEENPQGGQTIYHYDARGRSISVENALGQADSSSYDGQDHLIRYITTKDETTLRSFDADNNLTGMTDPLLNTSSNTYDSENRLETATDFRNNDIDYTYNTKHQVITITDRKGILIQTNTYDTDGNLKTVKDAEDNVTTYFYDSFGNVSRIDYPDATFETFVYNLRGDLTSQTDQRSNTTSFTYNNRRQPLITTFPDSSTQIRAYDSCGNLVSMTDNRGNATTYTYSPTLKRLDSTFPAVAAGIATITNEYDSRNWLETTTDPFNEETEYTYDAAGRPVIVTDPLNRSTTSTFDTNGRLASVTNNNSETTAYTYNSKGERTIVTDALSNDLNYSYDSNGNRTGINNRRGHDFTFSYDANNQQLTLATPLSRTSTHTWNDRGLLASFTEASSQNTAFTYDSLGRPLTSTDQVGAIAYGYDAAGNPTTVTENSIVLTRAFDNRNRVTSFTDAHGDTIGYQYDSNGNLTRLTYPGNKTVDYVYDARNQLTNVIDWNSRITSYTYDLNGRLTGITRPNGTTRTMVYDAAGQITRMEERRSNGKLFSLQDFAYDDAGRISREFIAPIPQSFGLSTHAVTYDNDNQIATFNSLTVVHDLDGNMTSGPLLSDSLVTYGYDARNRLTSAGGLSYAYDAEGNRISITEGSEITRFTVNPHAGLSQILIRTKPDGSKTYYVYGLGLLYEVDESENTHTYHYDYRGSTRFITADNGETITDKIEYTPYGQITHREGTTDTPFLYNGLYGVMTDSNGLLNMRARYFNPYIRRFINADPIGFAGGTNWYAYGSGNPVNRIDPRGTSDTSANTIVGSAFAGSVFGSNPLNGVFSQAEIDAFNAPKPIAYINNDFGAGFISEFGAELTPVGVFTAGRDFFQSPGILTAAALVPGVPRVGALGDAASAANSVPTRLSRVVDSRFANSPTLGSPRSSDVFVTAADDLAGITSSSGAAQRLTLLNEAGNLRQGPFSVIEFDAPTSGLASPVFRNDPGFIQGGFTQGGAREFVLPNLNVNQLQNVTIRSLDPQIQ
ncbi:MAG: polymorphic toxin type 10 domain-containing protein [Verrucomicrobiota bacterium]